MKIFLMIIGFFLLLNCSGNAVNQGDNSCNSNESCEKLADKFYAQNDFKNATPLYEKVCNEGGKPRTCQNAAAAYMTEEGVDRDLNKAYEYAKKGCEQNFQDACRVLEIVDEVIKNHNNQDENMKCLKTGVYAPINETPEERKYRLTTRNIDKIECQKYIADLDEECQKNQYGACFMLGLEYDKNPIQAVRTNKAKAKFLYQKACDGSNGKVMPEMCSDIDAFLRKK